MRLVSLDIAGFRAFPGSYHIDLNADAVIVVGHNGQGKTSLFDSILWALTGNVPRLSAKEADLISMYATAGEARVALQLRDEAGNPYRIVRSYDGVAQDLRVESNGDIYAGEEASFRIAKDLWPDALATSDAKTALTAAITRGVYLQQDLVRQFIDADSEQERFIAVSELVGVGRISELQNHLDRARTAWTRATTVRENEAAETEARLAAVDRELSSLSSADETFAWTADSHWSSWWESSETLGITVQRPPLGTAPEAPSSLEAAIKQLQALRRGFDRRGAEARALLEEISARSPMDETVLMGLNTKAQTLATTLREMQQQMTLVQQQEAEARRAQLAVREEREELRALAQIAIRHLHDKCPVCSQPYDRPATLRRLEELVGAPELSLQAPGDIARQVQDLSSRIVSIEQQLQLVAREIRAAESQLGEHRAWLVERDRRLRGLGIPDGPVEELLNILGEAVHEFRRQAATAEAQEKKGEYLALVIAQSSERARRGELEREQTLLRQKVAAERLLVHGREDTGKLATQISESLRGATADVVQAQLDRLDPLLQKVYARIDPHPSFRSVRLRSWFSHGKGHVAAVIEDKQAGLSTNSPEVVLSSSQMNALAVSVFLAFNLGLGLPPLACAILDDPLQSLDDVNLLGLIDLLRRANQRRQFLVSTHDLRFGRLLARKLRPALSSRRTIVIELAGWNREGPEVTLTEAMPEVPAIRLVA
jgi:DNA repair exonuclease SbcCD ATPase subunit